MNADALGEVLSRHKEEFNQLVEFDPVHDKIIPLDFTVANPALTEELLNDIDLFSTYINKTLDDSGARYGIGGYAEHRIIYSRSRLFDEPGVEEPRRLHLGLDIWGKAGTAVYAPLEGVVHSVGNNRQAGDYGATLILQHQLEDLTFFTLYGHLDRRAIVEAKAGDAVSGRQLIARFGLPMENGNWPPHLHFQVISDMEGRSGDFPGVCKFSERDEWLGRCPDPDLVAQLNRYIFFHHIGA